MRQEERRLLKELYEDYSVPLRRLLPAEYRRTL